MSVSNSPIHLFRNRNFLLLWLTSLISNIALGAAVVCETWYVIKTLNMENWLFVVLVAASIPRILLMFVGGVFADRFPQPWIISASLLIRAAFFFGLALLLFLDSLSFWWMVVFALFYGVLDAFFWPARDSVLPAVVERQNLGQANSVMLMTTQLGLIIGPLLGSLLLALIGYEGVFTATAVILLIGAACSHFIHVPRTLIVAGPMAVLSEIKEGIQYVLASPVLSALMLVFAVANLLFLGPLHIGVPMVAKNHLQGEAHYLASLVSSFAAGIMAGGLFMAFFPPQRKRLLLIVAMIVIEGVLLALLGNVYSLPLALLIQFATGFCIACNNIPMISLLQQHTEPGKIGRVMSLNSVTTIGLSPVSDTLVGALKPILPISWIMPIFGLGMSVVCAGLALKKRVIRETD
jgi:MFS transporter, DHA3 family, macrolide efflux protein